MAMNKKEKAEFEKLENDLRLAKALRFTEPVATDVPVPRNGNTKGFLFNEHGGYITYAASNFVHHKTSSTDFDENEKYGGWSQGARSLYSTRLLALRALRHAMEKRVAAELAAIDKQIEQENQ